MTISNDDLSSLTIALAANIDRIVSAVHKTPELVGYILVTFTLNVEDTPMRVYCASNIAATDASEVLKDLSDRLEATTEVVGHC